jgi:hypothetical protein
VNPHFALSQIADDNLGSVVNGLSKDGRKLSHQDFKALFSRVIKTGDTKLTIRTLSLQEHRSVKQYLDAAKLAKETPGIDGDEMSKAIIEKMVKTTQPGKYFDLYHGFEKYQSTLEKAKSLATKFANDATNPADKQIWSDILNDLSPDLRSVLYEMNDKDLASAVNRLFKDGTKLYPHDFKALFSRVIKTGDMMLTIRTLSLQKHRSAQQFLEAAKLAKETPGIDGDAISKAIMEKIPKTN